ncbi:RWD repeat domain-containing protein [Apiospora arundinis]|uniref:RWD repeat domain-containing protein n=1 Tax=Apiospora arundinis TaxID=335852 RepID=A0ABR2I286_9PEZI
MSEELTDEVEAINSIYGEGCLVQSNDDPNVYILTPPDESASLRIEFPAGYPQEPPIVIGTNSTGDHGKRGDAARELEMFREAVGSVYEPGMVCLFDAIEELKRRLEEHAELEHLQQEEEAAAAAPEIEDEPSQQPQAQDPMAIAMSIQEPPWVISDPFVELKSVFVARSANVSSTAEAEGFLQHLLASDKKVRLAHHNITAWRIKGPNNTSFQDCNDDGETAAGGRLLHLMQLMDIWDCMVIVTRWYGGHKLGPRRFALINQAARDAFVKAGFVSETSTGKKKTSGK